MSPLSIPDLHQMPVPSREEIAERVALQELFDALSWGASLFLGNCRRLNNVFDGTPEVFVTKYFPNPNRVPDTLAGIVDPGPERGRDERHCFCRLARAMQAIPESKAPFSDAARSFLDAIAAEARLLLDHAPCVELIDYWDAVRSLMSIVFQQEYPVMPPEEYRQLIRDKGLELAIARKRLYNRYCLPTPSVTLETLNSKLDTTSQTIISTLGGKVDSCRKSLLSALRAETSGKRDPRSPLARKAIDEVVLLYTRRTRIENRDTRISALIANEWEKLNKGGIPAPFANKTVFERAVRYDLRKFYDPAALIARARRL